MSADSLLVSIAVCFTGLAGVPLFNFETMRPTVPGRIPNIVVVGGVDRFYHTGTAACILLQQVQEFCVLCLQTRDRFG